ncbi:unnamed protein product [Larinioides sclopetarius]|uniref:Uncharacterized protein n=1 Tax=Larinioides sclopetarius TaxID=280406 RepID=A0AAV1ZW79_9ARAC
MTDINRKIIVLEFSRTFVNVVNDVLFSGIDSFDKSDLFFTLKKPLQTFLDRHKMELYFLYREELARFKKDLNEENFKELLESMIIDLKLDEYDSRVFSHMCIVISYFAAIARKNISTAHKLAARAIFDAIEHLENDETINEDIIEGIKNSLIETAEKIDAQKKSEVEKDEAKE